MTTLHAKDAKRRIERIAWWEARGVTDVGVVAIEPDEILKVLRTSFADTRKRARKRGLAFTVTLPEIETLYRMQHGRCAISGIPFSIDSMNGASRRPFAPSMDRRDNAQGYTPRNVRLVCVAVNIAMNEWGVDILLQIAAALLEKTRPENLSNQAVKTAKNEKNILHRSARLHEEATS